MRLFSYLCNLYCYYEFCNRHDIDIHVIHVCWRICDCTHRFVRCIRPRLDELLEINKFSFAKNTIIMFSAHPVYILDEIFPFQLHSSIYILAQLVGSLVSISEVRGSSLALSTTKISLILYIIYDFLYDLFF